MSLSPSQTLFQIIDGFEGGNQSREGNAPAKFHLFSKLPRELRNRIWHYSLPAPRNFKIHFVAKVDHHPEPISLSGIGPPKALYICRESREEALLIYKPRLLLYTCGNESRPMLCGFQDNIPRESRQTILYGIYTNQTPELIDSQTLNFEPHSPVQSVLDIYQKIIKTADGKWVVSEGTLNELLWRWERQRRARDAALACRRA
jgi:hypothetical protein